MGMINDRAVFREWLEKKENCGLTLSAVKIMSAARTRVSVQSVGYCYVLE